MGNSDISSGYFMFLVTLVSPIHSALLKPILLGDFSEVRAINILVIRNPLIPEGIPDI